MAQVSCRATLLPEPILRSRSRATACLVTAGVGGVVVVVCVIAIGYFFVKKANAGKTASKYASGVNATPSAVHPPVEARG